MYHSHGIKASNDVLFTILSLLGIKTISGITLELLPTSNEIKAIMEDIHISNLCKGIYYERHFCKKVMRSIGDLSLNILQFLLGNKQK